MVSEKTGYVWGEYLKISEASDKSIVDGQDSMDGEILKMLLYLMMQEAGKAAADQEPISETDGGLEPEGNLTLVDDLGSDSKEGQQFVTLVTKAGNYFYLVIDRSKDGEENVHFLNMVDEADLMALMEEEEAEKFFSVPEGAEEAAPTIPPDAEGEMELGKAEEPPMEEQQEIVDYLDNKCEQIDSIIETKKEQLTVLDEYKKVIIYEYATGKKEVP